MPKTRAQGHALLPRFRVGYAPGAMFDRFPDGCRSLSAVALDGPGRVIVCRDDLSPAEIAGEIRAHLEQWRAGGA